MVKDSEDAGRNVTSARESGSSAGSPVSAVRFLDSHRSCLFEGKIFGNQVSDEAYFRSAR